MADVIVEISKDDAHELMDKTAKFIAERRMGSAAILHRELKAEKKKAKELKKKKKLLKNKVK